MPRHTLQAMLQQIHISCAKMSLAACMHASCRNAPSGAALTRLSPAALSTWSRARLALPSERKLRADRLAMPSMRWLAKLRVSAQAMLAASEAVLHRCTLHGSLEGTLTGRKGKHKAAQRFRSLNGFCIAPRLSTAKAIPAGGTGSVASSCAD